MTAALRRGFQQGGKHGKRKKMLHTVQEIQEILDVSKPTVYKLIESKVFRSIKINDGKYRISKKSFDAWLDEGDEAAF